MLKNIEKWQALCNDFEAAIKADEDSLQTMMNGVGFSSAGSRSLVAQWKAASLRVDQAQSKMIDFCRKYS